MSNQVTKDVPSVLVVCFECEPDLDNPLDTKEGYRTTNTQTFKCIKCGSRHIRTLKADPMTIKRPEGEPEELIVPERNVN